MPDRRPGSHHQQAGQHDQLRRVSQCIHQSRYHRHFIPNRVHLETGCAKSRRVEGPNGGPSVQPFTAAVTASEIVVNKLFNWVPTTVMAAMHTTAISAASSPYSIIVTPSSAAKN